MNIGITTVKNYLGLQREIKGKKPKKKVMFTQKSNVLSHLHSKYYPLCSCSMRVQRRVCIIRGVVYLLRSWGNGIATIKEYEGHCLDGSKCCHHHLLSLLG